MGATLGDLYMARLRALAPYGWREHAQWASEDIDRWRGLVPVLARRVAAWVR